MIKYAIAGWLALASAAFPETSAKADTAAIGGLVLPYDPAVWRFRVEGGQMSLDPVEDRRDDLGIRISIQDGDTQTCSPQAMTERASRREDGADVKSYTLKRDGFDLHVAEVRLGCRNWTGSPIHACTAYRGDVYTFTADPAGCNTPPRYDEPVMDVLSGLRKR